MPTPWNSFSACLLAKSDRIGRDRLDLLNRGDAIPLGPAPWNFGSTCLAARSACIGEDCLNLLNRSDVIPLGFTPCNAKHISLGLYCSKKKSFQKLHQLSVGGAFLRLFW